MPVLLFCGVFMNKPFLKWPGGKFKLLDKILPHIGKPKRFVEPFVGAGSVYLNVEADEYILSDTNRDLITLYQYLMHDSEGYIRMASKLFNLENNTIAKYYELRKEFNKTSDLAKKAELFLYLNKHAYNGLVRYNNSGEFNSPFGKYSVVNFPENEIRFFARKLQQGNTRLFNMDFEKILYSCGDGDVVYCDPPYLPSLFKTNFTAYSEPFKIKAHFRLRESALIAASSGAKVIISNHDTENTRELYHEANIVSLEAKRSIGRDSACRKPVKEILAIFECVPF